MGIMEMGEAEALEKAWLLGRGGGRGVNPNYGGTVYVYGYESESYYLSHDQNGDNAPLDMNKNK